MYRFNVFLHYVHIVVGSGYFEAKNLLQRSQKLLQSQKCWQICRMDINSIFEAQTTCRAKNVGRMKIEFNFEAWNPLQNQKSFFHFFHSTNLPIFFALQGVWASKLEFMSILQIYQHFWVYKGFQAQKLIFLVLNCRIALPGVLNNMLSYLYVN